MTPADQYVSIQRPGAEPERVGIGPDDPCTFGRAQSNTVVLSDGSISRQHARIFHRDGSYWIEDLGSKNGTKLGSRRIEAPARLKPGDRLQLGSIHIIFSGTAEGSGSAAARVADVAAPINVRAVPLEEISSSGAIDTRSFASGLSPERVGNFFQAMDRVGRELLAYRPLEDLFQFIVSLAAEVLKADRTAILLRDGTGDGLTAKAVSQSGRGANEEIVVSRSIARMAIGQRQAILTSDAQSDTRFRAQESVIQQRIHSAMCAPLWHDGDVLGLIYVDNVAAPVPFEDGDLRLLTFIAHLAAVKIQETERHEAAMARDEELRRAAALQQALLPTEPRVVDSIQIAGRNVPSLDVGGDYFDFVDAPDGTLVVGLGDVAGKGMPAAILMTHLAASVRAQVETERPLTEIMSRLNRSTHQSVRGGDRFITLVLASVDTKSGDVVYVNAGHNPPILLRRSGAFETLTEGGLILGIIPDTAYASGTLRLERGDVLLLYSDGVTEARDTGSEQFGEDRLMEFLGETGGLRPEDLVETLIQRVREYSSPGKPGDDVTVVVMRRS